MSHLLILCEGQLEKKVLKPFLQPYCLPPRFQSVEVQAYSGNGDLMRHFKGDAETQLRTEPDSSVLCLIDLYNEPFQLYQPKSMTPTEGYQSLKAYMESLIDNRYAGRFAAFPVVMELETWLLADPHLQHSLGFQVNQPEAVPHPTAFLEQHYAGRQQTYRKLTTGVTLFAKASAVRVYEDHCLAFKALVDWLTTSPQKAPSAESLASRQWKTRLDELYSQYERLNAREETDSTLRDEVDAALAAYEAHCRTKP